MDITITADKILNLKTFDEFAEKSTDEILWDYLLDLEYIANDIYVDNLLIYITDECIKGRRFDFVTKLISERINYVNRMVELRPAIYYRLDCKEKLILNEQLKYDLDMTVKYLEIITSLDKYRYETIDDSLINSKYKSLNLIALLVKFKNVVALEYVMKFIKKLHIEFLYDIISYYAHKDIEYVNILKLIIQRSDYTFLKWMLSNYVHDIPFKFTGKYEYAPSDNVINLIKLNREESKIYVQNVIDNQDLDFIEFIVGLNRKLDSERPISVCVEH